MTRQIRWQFLMMLCLLSAALPATAWGAWADHLDIIGYDRVQADSRFNTLLGANMGIAIFDTGVDGEHFSFASRNVTGSNFNTSNLAPKAPPNHQDGNGHGTQVGSIAAGNHGTITSLNIQLGGIAHGADVVAVRVLDNAGNGSFTQIIAGMDWVTDQIVEGENTYRRLNLYAALEHTYAIPEPGALLLLSGGSVLLLLRRRTA